jgi:hypothetical protein
MRTRIVMGMALLLLGSASGGYAQDVIWRAAKPASSNSVVSLGQPTPLSAAGVPEALPRVVRGQIGDVPPPPAFPGAGGGPVFPSTGGPQMYNQGVVNRDGDVGGFWTRVGDKFQRCWEDVSGGVGGAFQGSPTRQVFQSDRCFEVFSSPVTNPFFFEDPRSLTEIRPVFMWQHTPSANPVWNGGNNFVYALAGSVAFTEHISLVVNRFGFETISPKIGTPDIQSHTGFSEILLGPKLTFLRNETSNTVAAVGLTFDIPDGSGKVLQNTGHLALIPYFSIAQNFGRSDYGSFNFMNTTGYTFRTDNTRTESLYSSFHLDYNVKNANRFFPLIEMNWRHYTRNGGARALDFEGSDLANFGSQSVSGLNELTLAIGTRVVITRNIQWGVAGEFNVLNNSTGRHLDQFRLTTDFIFRY